MEETLFCTEAVGQDTLLTLYKLYLDTAEKISDRRAAANSHCLSINAGLFAILGYIYSKDAISAVRTFAVFIPCAGVLVCIFWGLLVRSYRRLNSTKYQIIQLIETRLPIAPFTAEWSALACGRDPRRYTPLSNIENLAPLSTALMHMTVLFLLP